MYLKPGLKLSLMLYVVIAVLLIGFVEFVKCDCPSGEYLEAKAKQCKKCDPACATCQGKGPQKCDVCAKGYERKLDACLDIDECKRHKNLCQSKVNGEEASAKEASLEKCENRPGSYACVCVDGFERDPLTSKCAPSASRHIKDGPATTASKAQNDTAQEKLARKILRKQQIEYRYEVVKTVFVLVVFVGVCAWLKGRVFVCAGFSVGLFAFLYSEALTLDDLYRQMQP